MCGGGGGGGGDGDGRPPVDWRATRPNIILPVFLNTPAIKNHRHDDDDDDNEGYLLSVKYFPSWRCALLFITRVDQKEKRRREEFL